MTRGSCVARLASMIAAVQRPHPARVALDGVDGAGKTHLADELVGPLSRVGRQMPGQRRYLGNCEPKIKADVVFDNSDFEKPRVTPRA